MLELYLDTHALVWLFERDASRFPAAALTTIETATALWLPAMAMQELEYLHQKGVVTVPASEIYTALNAELNVRLNPTAHFAKIAVAAIDLRWTRDPFDRLIVAEALLCGDKLLSKDALIRANCSISCWE